MNEIGLRVALIMQGMMKPELKREEGQTLAEYALILALIAAVVGVAVIFLQGKISSMFSQVGNDL
jgi:Flp pilus assembly pilin Flp